MDNYYAEKLGAQKLFQVYETKIPRVKQYLQAETDFVRSNLSKAQNVLELGAGYGRIVRELAPCCSSIVGIDISEDSVALGKAYLAEQKNADIRVMDIHHMDFSNCFDVILCMQNGLSAMSVDSADIKKILGFLSFGGTAYFSSYSDKFWEYRIQWFEEQVSKGLLGNIDYERTQNGVIVCQDGFRAVTYTEKDLQKIGEQSECPYSIQEVDESSLFLVIYKK